MSVSGPGLSESEEKIVAAMTPASQLERRTLADIIMEKIQQKEEGINDQRNNNNNNNSNDEDQAEEEELFPPKVIEVYTQIGAVLSRYTAGKLPKAFKVIPSLQNWEDVLYLTRPDKWTPQAMFAATRIFSSNLNPAMAQRFYNLILLDSVRADIVENKTLNYHYYMSLKKSLYKPSAFYKGVLLPLCKGERGRDEHTSPYETNYSQSHLHLNSYSRLLRSAQRAARSGRPPSFPPFWPRLVFRSTTRPWRSTSWGPCRTLVQPPSSSRPC